MIGSILDEKYRIVQPLGAGGMGAVYEGVHTATGRKVAIKVITSVYAQNQDVINRFKHEALAAGRIDTKHITQVLDAGVDRNTGLPFLVMEFLTGRDVSDIAKKLGPLASDLALRIVAQSCLGLQKAHDTGVVHRDIKPANLFLAESDGELIVKVLDFGIAKVQMEHAQETENAALTRTGNMLGSPLYMSPEQAQGLKGIDARADIWSLGVTLYQLLCGRTPYQEYTALGQLIVAISSTLPPSIQFFAPWVPPEVAAIVHGCLRHDPNQRFQSAKDLLAAIKQLLPYGWAIQPEMLVSLSESSRSVAVAAYELPARRPVSVAAPSASVPPLAHSASTQMLSQHPGAGSNPNASSQSGSQVLVQSQIATAKRPNSVMPLVFGAAAAIALGLVVVIYGVTQNGKLAPPPAPPPTPTQSVPTEPVPTPTAPVSALAPTPIPVVTTPREDTSVRRVRVVIIPGDAHVEVEGKAVTATGGVLELEGRLGDEFKVVVSKGNVKLPPENVIIVKGGADPALINLYDKSTSKKAPSQLNQRDKTF